MLVVMCDEIETYCSIYFQISPIIAKYLNITVTLLPKTKELQTLRRTGMDLSNTELLKITAYTLIAILFCG